MATVVTHSPRWTSALVPAVDATAPDHRRTIALPPREVWPLLATIVVTWLLMLAMIAWYAVPGVAALASAFPA